MHAANNSAGPIQMKETGDIGPASAYLDILSILKIRKGKYHRQSTGYAVAAAQNGVLGLPGKN
jgi:hypothetical protein